MGDPPLAIHLGLSGASEAQRRDFKTCEAAPLIGADWAVAKSRRAGKPDLQFLELRREMPQRRRSFDDS
jgi:hypothetical protein